MVGDAEGDYEIALEVRNSRDQVVTKLMGAAKLRVRTRKEQAEFGIQTHMLPIPKEDRYFFRLYFNGEPAVREAYFDAERLDPQKLGGMNAPS